MCSVCLWLTVGSYEWMEMHIFIIHDVIFMSDSILFFWIVFLDLNLSAIGLKKQLKNCVIPTQSYGNVKVNVCFILKTIIFNNRSVMFFCDYQSVVVQQRKLNIKNLLALISVCDRGKKCHLVLSHFNAVVLKWCSFLNENTNFHSIMF